MTYGKLKELLAEMSETQLHKEVVACNDYQGEHSIVLKIKDIRILRGEADGTPYPALVA
jgi:hypothetical protein